MELKGIPFAKGHGTGNDFVVVPDPNGELNLDASTVAALCDRRLGIGGDGLLRAVRTAAEPEVAGRTGEADWFMDYRNADGSLAKMCGNGVRVFARYLVESGLAAGPRVQILTRAGRVVARVDEDGVEAELPAPVVAGRATVRVAGSAAGPGPALTRTLEVDGTMVTAGNPNLVCWVSDPDALDLAAPLALAPGLFPYGANVEFIVPIAAGSAPASGSAVVSGSAIASGSAVVSGPAPASRPQSDAPLAVRMRVVERGVGETLSCGSGACAVAAVVLRDAGRDRGEVLIETRGGRLRVSLGPEHCVLAGPAVIVASGTLEIPPPITAEGAHATSPGSR